MQGLQRQQCSMTTARGSTYCAVWLAGDIQVLALPLRCPRMRVDSAFVGFAIFLTQTHCQQHGSQGHTLSVNSTNAIT